MSGVKEFFIESFRCGEFERCQPRRDAIFEIAKVNAENRAYSIHLLYTLLRSCRDVVYLCSSYFEISEPESHFEVLVGNSTSPLRLAPNELVMDIVDERWVRRDVAVWKSTKVHRAEYKSFLPFENRTSHVCISYRTYIPFTNHKFEQKVIFPCSFREEKNGIYLCDLMNPSYPSSPSGGTMACTDQDFQSHVNVVWISFPICLLRYKTSYY